MSFQLPYEQTPPSKMRKNSRIISNSQETVKIVQRLDFNLANNKRILSFRLNKGPLTNRLDLKTLAAASFKNIQKANRIIDFEGLK